MPRNAEVIRQWSILRDLESSRRVTIDELAERTGVTTRTIRRDLEALQSAGFPIFDEQIDGKRYWTLEARAFKRLDDTSFTVAELSALYFSRTLLECLAATPFQKDVESAFEKLAGALTPSMRQFLDRLPLVFQAKGSPALSRSVKGREMISRLLDATLQHRRARITYYSLSSAREKDYAIEPYRLVYSQGGLYLIAFVAEYKTTRTFSVERIRALSVSEERFTPPAELPEVPFEHSIGVHEGQPEHIEIRFDPRIAPYVRERQLHASQKNTDNPDGSLQVEMDVCNDWALRSWILSFGPLARVVSPSTLVDQIRAELTNARGKYTD